MKPSNGQRVRGGKKAIWALALAVAAGVPILLPSAASAQIADGHANDANNRVGSNGSNGQGQQVPYGTLGNQIVYGNISGGKGFSGRLQSTDPMTFRGNVPSVVSAFNANSVGVPLAQSRDVTPNAAMPFYSESRWVNPPAGYVPNATNTGFVPAPSRISLQANQVNSLLQDPNLYEPRPDVLLLPGPVENQQQTVYSLSPLYGIQRWNPYEQGDLNYLERFANISPDTSLDRLNIDPSILMRIRREVQINGTETPEDQNAAKNPNGPLSDAAPAQPLADTASPANAAAAPGNQVISPGAGTTQVILSAPTQQSAVYRRLYERYEERYGKEMANTLMYNKMLADKRAADEKAAADQQAKNHVGPGQGPLQPATLPATLPTLTQGGGGTVKVNSLSEGIQSKGLAEMLKKAETLMRAGKYAAAADQYDAAQQAVPNNPLIWLGRANAELAGGFYSVADRHLREAFSTDRALLMGQYNLREMIGQERLQFLVKDLRELAEKDQTSPTPVFLLAYIAYNTNNEAKALGYLDLAQKRTGGKDAFIQAVREAWAPNGNESNTLVPQPQNK